MRPEQVLIPMVRGVVHRPWLASTFFRFDRWGNLFSEEAYRDPYPGYAAIRADGPVSYRGLYQQWFVSGYDEVRAVLASDRVRSGVQIEVLLDVRPYSKLSPRARWLFRNLMIVLDPPDHDRLRRLVSKGFTPRRVAELEPTVRALADDLLSDVRREAGSGPWEMVAGFNERLPINVIGELLGLPRDLWAWARSVTAQLARLLNPFETFDPAEVDAAAESCWEVYGELADRRRADPRSDLVSALVAAEDDGDRLNRDELVLLMVLLAAAGSETTSNLLGNAALALAAHPDQRARLRAEPELWPNAVEELIRYDTSVRRAARHTVADLTVGGVTIPAGSNVLLMLDAANRDPRQHRDPDVLRLDRPDPRPITFGHGIHHCLGAALARLELRVGLQSLLDAAGDWTVDPAAVRWKRSATLRGASHLPLQPAPAA